jgi:hypothetical protein
VWHLAVLTIAPVETQILSGDFPEAVMSKRKWISLPTILNLILFNGIVLTVLNLRYPLVGHDYTYSLPSFLDTAIHYRLNGLAIQWFTPTFGGGIPAFPNPNHMQYSLPALLAVFLAPWPAVMTSVVIYLSVGFVAAYYFFHQTLKLHWTAAVLGALFFSANGFSITRIAAGQEGYFSFALLPLFLIFMLDKHLPARMAAVLFGLVFATYVYSAGYFVLIIFGLSIAILLPMLFLFRPELFHWKRIFLIMAFGAAIGLIISAAKLAASFSFMRHFPRLIEDNYPVSFLSGLTGLILQLLGTQSLVPMFLLGGLAPSSYPTLTRAATGTHYGMWELDISMTPVVFIILLIFTIQVLYDLQKYWPLLQDKQKRAAVILLVLFGWLAIEFTLAKGFIYPLLRQLPILSSLRGNVRFAGAFIFPLALLAAVIYHRWSKTWDSKKLLRMYVTVNLLAILPLGSYFLFDQDMFWMFYDIAGPQRIYDQIKAGDSFEITGIGSPEGNNTGALLSRTSNLNVYEPVFGFELEYFHPQVREGSIWNLSGGYYNMTDPTGYVYPELNNNQSFERFRVEDKATLELFVKHIQPNWKIPTFQHALNWVSGITFLSSLFYVVTRIAFNRIKSMSKPA